MITGQRDLLNAFKAAGKKGRKIVSKAVFITAQEVRNNAVTSLNTVSTGDPVTRHTQGGRPYTHIAAAPEHAPNTDTGRLVQSVAVEQQTDLTAYVGTNVDYGKYLEFGTSNMEERPWLNPALERVRAKGSLQSNIKKLYGRVGRNK